MIYLHGVVVFPLISARDCFQSRLRNFPALEPS
jgi:hypothetical protein